MRLFLPSLFLFMYTFLSLVLPLHWPSPGKIAAALALLAASMKYLLYEQLGGSFFAPDLPRLVILSTEALYAALVILAVLLLVKDVAALVSWLARQAGATWRLPLTPAFRSAVLLGTALVMAIWGTWQAVKVPDVRTVEITVPKLPARLDGFSIVQLSDLHIWPLVRRDWLQSVVEKTNSLQPDVVAVTGDMIDGLPDLIGREVEPFGDLQTKYGVFGVTGNHEYYFQADGWLPVFERLGIEMLHNEHRVLSVDGEEIVIAGVPDIQEQRFGGEGPDVDKAFRGAPDTTRILLDHRPGTAGSTLANVQLSGHTHGGTMFFIQKLIANYNGGLVNGLYDVNGMQLYVSPGTGIWGGFASRIGVPSEITRIVLRAEKA
ncbi:MAG: metallophosphoesterase [Clostridia bacterium]|nr:metallophosphoesterase [Clostridia bacterium]